MIIALTEIRVHSLISVRTFPGSASQPSYAIPPPTTALGALAKSWLLYVRKECRELVEQGGKVYSAATRFLETINLRYIAVGLKMGSIPPKVVGQPTRLMTGIYQSLKTREEWASSLRLHDFFGPYVVGYSSYPGQPMILYLAVEGLSNDLLGELRAALWSVNRLGSRESVVSVDRVVMKSVSAHELEAGSEVNFVNPLPTDYIEILNGSRVFTEETIYPETMDEWMNHFSRDVDHYTPPVKIMVYPLDVARARLRRRCLAIELDNELADLLGISPPKLRRLAPKIVIPLHEASR